MSYHRNCVEMIQSLIAMPSVSSVLPELDQSNQRIIEMLADWLDDAGFETEILPVEPSRGKFNLLATKGHGKGGLVLSGHTDTVPTDPDRWHQDPFKLIEKDGRLYGLGTSDMKSFLALAIEAGRDYQPNQFKQPLIILATADEESTMSGAQALVNMGKPLARSAIIGEPTSNRPVRLHKGIMMERIHVTGQSGHSSNPALGHNALEGMHTVIDELLNFRAELQSQYRNNLFEIPVPTLNLGHIHGGDNPNRICGECTLDIDIRPLPGMSIEELRGMLRQRLNNRLRDTPFKLELSVLFRGTDAMETGAESRLVRLTEVLTDQSAAAVAFATEGPYLQKLGMDVVIMGPGRIDQAHQPNEYLELSFVEPTVTLLRQLITQHCIIGGKPDKR